MPIRDKKTRNAKLRAWREKNPDRAWAHELKRRYGFTPEQFNELLKKQGGVCAVCGQNEKLCIDHDHATGQIRGLLCHGCNLILGHAKDSIEVLERAIGYLKAIRYTHVMNELATFHERCLGLPPVKFKRIAENAKLPSRGTPFAVGMDIYANETVQLLPGQQALIGTGLLIEVPEGYEAQVRSRSGLAAKHRVSVVNSPGTIDPDYRGELKVLLVNDSGAGDFWVSPGDRIAQLVIAPVSYNQAVLVDELSPAPTRGDAGFGSTGTR